LRTHPYVGLPDYAYWRRSVTAVECEALDPVVSWPFSITKSDRVATAGSCFAQHIARYLKNAGFNFYVTETAHPLLVGELLEKAAYGIFTARYGNIYTSRQLVQLFERAYGKFFPKDDIWKETDGRFLDAFRPTIQPGGFCSRVELVADRAQHLTHVREAFENLDFFIFTLGLTECWVSRLDGAVYPVCPGVSGGQFDPSLYEFKNLDVAEVFGDISEFVSLLRSVNPAAKVILTVSPVPLAASASGQHALTATTLSKSILRVAAHMAADKIGDVAYFPSYEIVTGAYTRGRYYAPDLRNVTEDGVAHVMSIFMKHAAETVPADQPKAAVRPETDTNDAFLAEMKNWVAVMCEEQALDPTSE
jgi:hypothetical protein